MICRNKTLRAGLPTDEIVVKAAERTCVITSKDQNITKAHARYLESRLLHGCGTSVTLPAKGLTESLPQP